MFYAVYTPDAPVLAISSTTRDSCTVEWSAVSPPTNSLIYGYVISIDNGKGSGVYTVAYDGSLNPSTLEATITGLSP